MNQKPRASIPANSAVLLPLALLVACLAGCVDQNKEVAMYRKVLDGPHPQSVGRDYSRGKELTLETALLLANGYNEQLGIQGETYLQSLIERDRAYSAFLPTISLAPTYSLQNKPLNRGGSFLSGGTGTTTSGSGLGGTTGGTSTGSVVSSSHKYTALDVPVAARANLFNGLRDVSSLRAAYADVRRQQGLLLDLQATVLLEAAQTYYQVLSSERSVEVLNNSVQLQDARVQDMLGRLRAGIAQPLDYAQSEANAAATRVQLVTAENDVRNGRITLAFLTNADVEDAKLVDRLEVPENILPTREAVQIAEQERQDIRAAAAFVEESRQNVQVAIGEYYPSISVTLDYYLHRETFPTNVEWAGLLTANVPIFSAGTIRADVRAAWSRLRQALLQEWQLVRQVSENVQQDWENLSSSRRRLRELDTEVAASQEALRQATQRYQVGLAINLDVLNAQNQLLSSQLNLASEEFNYKIFYLDLLRAMGRLPRPAGPRSMSSGATSRPTREQTQPVLPTFELPPMTLPASVTNPAPTTQPATEPGLVLGSVLTTEPVLATQPVLTTEPAPASQP